MESSLVLKENWLTRKPHKAAWDVTIGLGLVVFIFGFSYLQDLFHIRQWMAASGEMVFHEHQYWRLWTALFAHADLEHLLSNAIFFFPFTYFLSSYFGLWFVPILGLLMGGVINFFVLQGMPPQINLIGISGVVYWLGAAWLTLFFMIDHRQSLRRRIAKVAVISLVLFAPQVYKPEVSYMSHAVGYLFGMLSALVYYWIYRKKFLKAEIYEVVVDEDDKELENFSS